MLIALTSRLRLVPGRHPALWPESVAVGAFGVAWLPKGRTVTPKSVP